MQWTHEQSPIIQSKASKILVRAFAGTGKTTTLVGFAKANPTLRILYLCYNSSVEKAAKGKFPRNVVCKTAHSLAHAVYGIQYAHKKTKNLRLTDIARGLDTQDWELVRDVLATLNNYMASADAELGRPHFPRFRDKAFLTSAQERFLKQGLDMARVVWRRMVDLQDTGMLMPHDGYLKLYQLSKPDLSQRFDCMLLDEGQDINPVIADIAHWQRIKMAIVGDPHQQLYRFRGAEDALNSDWMVGAEEHYLTQSWRFGVAHVREQTALFPLMGRLGIPMIHAAAHTPLAGLKMPMWLASKMHTLVNDKAALKACLKDRTSAGNWASLRFLSSYLSYAPTIEPEDFKVCPVLLTQPAADRWTPLTLSQPFLQRLRHVEVTTCLLDNAGHYPLEEPGLEQMNAAILAFIQRTLTGSECGFRSPVEP
ncbi:DNA helicase [Pseudomonas aeruginosa]|nr:DNA helicase [Pseudomonas aeruginosa]